MSLEIGPQIQIQIQISPPPPLSLRITHVGPNGPDAVYPSLAAWCAALGGKPKSPFAGVFTAAFLPLDHLRQRCAYGLAPPREGPVPWSPREAPTLPIALWAGAAELDGSLGPDRCFRLRLRYRRKPTISDRAEILRLLSDVVDAVLGMNMYWLPENRAGRRPLLYRVTLDRGIVHILAQSVWRYARACPWSVSDQRTADAADAAVHVDVLHVDPAQKAHGVARAARHFEGLIERLRPKPADPRLECRRALDEAVGQCRGDGVKSAPYHLVYLNGLTMVKDFLTAKVDGVNQLLAYLGTEGNGQVAHLEDFVRGAPRCPRPKGCPLPPPNPGRHTWVRIPVMAGGVGCILGAPTPRPPSRFTVKGHGGCEGR